MKWEQPPRDPIDRVPTIDPTYDALDDVEWIRNPLGWLIRRREALRIRLADRAAKTAEHDGPYPTLSDPMRRPEYR